MYKIIRFIPTVDPIMQIVNLQLNVRIMRVPSGYEVASCELDVRVFFRHIIYPVLEDENKNPDLALAFSPR